MSAQILNSLERANERAVEADKYLVWSRFISIHRVISFELLVASDWCSSPGCTA